MDKGRASRSGAPGFSEQLLRAMLDTATDPVLVTDLNGRIVLATGPTKRVLGVAPHELNDADFAAFVPPPSAAPSPSGGARPAEPAGPQEVSGRRSDGTVVPLDVTSRAIEIDGHPLHIHVVRDIADRKAVESQLAALAHSDPLTGLANRTRFRQQLDRATRLSNPFALLFIDLDEFKGINDEWGHDTGDRVLTNIGRRLEGAVRDQDLLARWGGDEFVVLAAISSEHDVGPLAERVQEAFTHPVTAYGHRFAVRASIGVALYPDDDRSPNRLIHLADLAMYRTKREARGSWERYHPDHVVDPTVPVDPRGTRSSP